MKTAVDVKTMALQRAVKILNSIGASYKIITEDGGEFGDLEVVKTTKKKNRYPFGVLRSYYGPIVSDMAVGDVRLVPIGEYCMESIQSGICSYAGILWGNGSVMTRRDSVNNAVEVLRVT